MTKAEKIFHCVESQHFKCKKVEREIRTVKTSKVNNRRVYEVYELTRDDKTLLLYIQISGSPCYELFELNENKEREPLCKSTLQSDITKIINDIARKINIEKGIILWGYGFYE